MAWLRIGREWDAVLAVVAAEAVREEVNREVVWEFSYEICRSALAGQRAIW